MKKLGKNITIFLLLAAFLLPSIPTSSANFSVTMNILSAYYQDTDQDGFEDDIVIETLMELTNNKIKNNIEIYVGIEKPSGEEVWFLAEFIIIKYSSSVGYKLTFDLLNTATESGWYTAYCVGFANNDQFSIMDSLEFDPPGGTDQDGPSGSMSIIQV